MLRYPELCDTEPIVVSQAWIAVNTQPQREALAAENLKRQSFETYCPRLRKRVRHARKAQDVLRPMFPGYLFVRIDAALQHWRPIKSTVGVRTIVSCGTRPSVLSNGFIAALKARECDGAIVRPEASYRVGQRVSLAGGPFDSLVGTIVAMDDRERLTLLMELLSGQVKVHVEAAACMPL